MMIKVKAFARFREAFGKELSLESDGKAAITDLLVGLCEPHNAHDIIFDESGMIKKCMNILVNGRHIQPELVDGGRGCDIPSSGRWLK